jgi:hypothetical protein
LAKGRRQRRRARGGQRPASGGAGRGGGAGGVQEGREGELSLGKLTAPSTDYDDEQGNALTLRGSLTIGARQEYARTLSGASARPGASREDTEQRAFELLFERLAVRWQIAGAPIERQRELLARFRAATPAERAFVRGALRAHCAENFPELQAP